VDNTDADITAKYFGCQFINSLYEDHCFQAWQFDTPSGYTNRNRQANITGVNGTFFPTAEAANDAFIIGDRDRGFFGLEVDLSTLGVGTPTLAFEYWDGTAWTALDGLVDGTSGLTADGRITWAKPADWASRAENSVTAFYMRIRIVSGTFSTNPQMTSCRPLFAGLMKWEQANARAISCLFSGCGPVSVRNGALLRKCIITDSNAGAVGAVDLGAADPATDSVRDLQIQNSTAGILLRKTAAGDVTYNFRNIIFAGNTKDVRVDFPSGSTVTINVLEGGSSLVAGDIDNVNGSTIVINNATVTTLVNVKDNNAANLQNARVLLEAADGTGDLNFEQTVTITRVSSTATVSHTAHGMANGDKVVIRGADQQEYNGVWTISNVSANAYDYTVSGTPATPATGTILESGVMLEGLTDVNGNISDTRTITLDTPLKGFVRKASASPRFKSFTLAGTTDNLVGLTINVRMILDE
jgi:hypothetical protein